MSNVNLNKAWQEHTSLNLGFQMKKKYVLEIFISGLNITWMNEPEKIWKFSVLKVKFMAFSFLFKKML